MLILRNSELCTKEEYNKITSIFNGKELILAVSDSIPLSRCK